MYEGLRLTELHEEAGWLAECLRRANLEKREMDAARTAGKLLAYEAEIRARVAAQPVGRPETPGFPYTRDGKALVFELFSDPAAICAFGPLVFGVPDARRDYRQRYGTIAIPLFSDWTNHGMHAVPVEGCHLCREGR